MIRQIYISVRGLLRKMNEDHVSAYSAQAAYFVLLSFIPCMLLLLTSIQYTPLTKQQVVAVVLQVCPESFQGLITNIIDEVYTKSLAVLPITAVTALWSAGKGVQALTNGLNCIYHVKETRRYIATRIRSILYTMIFIAAIVLTLILLVFGNSIQNKLTIHFPFLADLISLIIGLRTIITLLFLAVIFLFLYKFVPNRKSSLRSQLPGAALTAVAWAVFSFGFSLYFDYSSGIANMYGSMTSIILVLLWMYFCMNIVMIGAEINCYFEEKFRLVHELAREKIRKEYQQLIENNEDDEGTGEKNK